MTDPGVFASRILDQRKKEVDPKDDVDMTDVLDDFQRKARDHARVPMQVLDLTGNFALRS